MPAHRTPNNADYQLSIITVLSAQQNPRLSLWSSATKSILLARRRVGFITLLFLGSPELDSQSLEKKLFGLRRLRKT